VVVNEYIQERGAPNGSLDTLKFNRAIELLNSVLKALLIQQ